MEKKFEELLTTVKNIEVFGKKPIILKEEKKTNPLVWVLIALGAVAAVAAIAYAVYYFLIPDYIEEFDEDFDDEFDDYDEEFFIDETEIAQPEETPTE